MTTVHEAAIANGWDPADGSPWVGPDGVTYASKDAFEVAQIVARAQAQAKADPAHRENCLCSKAARLGPAEMWDERNLPGGMLQFDVLELLARKLKEAGSPMVRTYVRRYNAAGDGIGPDMGIRSCDALLFYRVYDRVLTAIARGAERQR
jgi:hypothetical protein